MNTTIYVKKDNNLGMVIRGMEIDPAGWPKCKSLATSKDAPSGSASHHVSVCPSRLNSSQEPEENRVAPLRPIAL